MRHAVLAGALALFVGAPAVASAQASAAQKFAFVNSQAIMAAAPGRVEAEAKFDKEMEGMRALLTKAADSLNAMTSAYDKEQATLAPAAKEARIKVLREKNDDYQERLQKMNDQAEQMKGELMQPIIEVVRRVLDDVRTEGGYSFIFDVAGGAFIVSADKNLDITDRVVAKVKLVAPPRAAAPKAGTPAAGPAAAPTGLKKPPTQ
ncbi:MAG TPA: OmpH family outer membrane protein [Gemmatimonas sp.]|nr:OmpH family outer membrane protein [Gemmatimonas sp.]